jgi:osmotically-inducible protein OsmY
MFKSKKKKLALLPGRSKKQKVSLAALPPLAKRGGAKLKNVSKGKLATASAVLGGLWIIRRNKKKYQEPRDSGNSTGSDLNAADLKAKVESEIFRDNTWKKDVSVTVENSKVILHGILRDQDTYTEIVDRTIAVDGVQDLENRITLDQAIEI